MMISSIKKSLPILLLAAILLLPETARALLIAECADITYIQAQADLIVEGKIVGIRYERNDVGHVFTYVDFKVGKYLRGEGPALVTIKQFGGEYEENGEMVYVRDSDSPEFVAGESGVLYLMQPDTEFYAGKFYTTVCSTGIMAADQP